MISAILAAAPAALRFLTSVLLRRADTEQRHEEMRLRFQEKRAAAQGQIPGFAWLLAPMVVISSAYVGSVVLYSMLFCSACISPQTWVIAKLPEPIDSYVGAVMAYLFFYEARRRW